MNQTISDTQIANVLSIDGEGDHVNDDTQTLRVASPNGNGDEADVHELYDTHFSDDLRPPPKPRHNPQLWQSYLWWYELMELRKRHLLRISSCEAGKSNLDAEFEREMMGAVAIDAQIENVKKTMINYGKTVPVWDWVTSIKGLKSGSLAAQLLSQIDDINKFETVSKLWRFSGLAVFNGKAEKNAKGEKSHFNNKLKGICFNIADMFIKHQTPGYVDIYYTEKAKLRELHPDVMCKDCGLLWAECKSKKSHKRMYNDGHLHTMAWRKMVKEFLKNLWIEWRKRDLLDRVTHSPGVSL